jgi:hypothetical protein
MPQAVTIRSLARAFELVKGMQAAHGLEWGEDYSKLSRDAIAAILPHQGQSIDEHLDRIILSRQRLALRQAEIDDLLVAGGAQVHGAAFAAVGSAAAWSATGSR